MRDALTTFGELVGALLISYGAWLAWAPLGFMTFGLLLIGLCVVVAL